MINLIKDILKSKLNYQIGQKTWFGTGGKASIFLTLNSIESLTKFLKYTPKSLPLFLIGSGSNILIRDGGFDGIAIKLGNYFKKINYNCKNNILTIGGAAKDIEIAKFCLENSIIGFEYLRGIPGTLGGNLKMNAGCYDGVISENLLNCIIVRRDGKITKFKKKDINFGYRSSSISRNSIIVEANFLVKIGKKSEISKKLKKINDLRNFSQPITSRTGGSTFKNPPNNEAWKLIDKINFRGKKNGGANVSSLHANFLINNGNATSLDIEMLGEEIREKVKRKFNIKLSWELVRIGKFRKL